MVWGLILNTILLILQLVGASPLPLDVEVSFFRGIKHSSVDGHSAMSLNFGILTKENKCIKGWKDTGANVGDKSKSKEGNEPPRCSEARAYGVTVFLPSLFL